MHRLEMLECLPGNEAGADRVEVAVAIAPLLRHVEPQRQAAASGLPFARVIAT